MTTPQMRQIAAATLSKASVFDNRKGESDHDKQLTVAGWAEVLDPATTLDDALEAVSIHYKAETTWLMPAHVNRITARMRAARVAGLQVQPPAELADQPSIETRWLNGYTHAAGQGADHDQATSAAWQHIGRAPAEQKQLTGPPADVRQKLNQLKATFGRNK